MSNIEIKTVFSSNLLHLQSSHPFQNCLSNEQLIKQPILWESKFVANSVSAFADSHDASLSPFLPPIKYCYSVLHDRFW